MTEERERRFRLGRIGVEPEDQKTLNPDDVNEALQGHAAGHWGQVDTLTRVEKDEAIANGALASVTSIRFDRDGHDATWTPDGRSLTYLSGRSGPLGIYRVRPGNAERSESLLASANVSYTGHWLPDGSALVTTASGLRPNSLLDAAIIRNGG